MLTTSLFVVLVLAALYTESAEACSRRRRRPPPPPPPPPGTPPVPPTPPPIVKVIREREQVMTRNNCKQVAITAKNDQALSSNDGDMSATQVQAVEQARAQLNSNECLNSEDFQYVCEFTVYSEIALTTIYHPTGCGCAFTISVVKPRPPTPAIPNVMGVTAEYTTKVTRFAMVVFDVEADQVVEEIPAFSEAMSLNSNTTKMIENQIHNDITSDFASVTAGFAGTVKEFPELPASLNKNDPVNKNNVPAIMFTIQQQYTSGALFSVPCKLEMHKAPNAYVSQCQPFRKDSPFEYSKRAALGAEETEQSEAPKAWFREFYLFPKQSNECGNSGYKPLSRYITSFYTDPNCKVDNGFLSFDREFESQFESSPAVVGGWEWTRTFAEARVVFGVPHAFSPLTAVWCLGYSQIDWSTKSGFQPTTAPITTGVCDKLPATAQWAGDRQTHKYKEAHTSFPITGDVQCAPAFEQCQQDLTLLGFQNHNPRDFEKKEDSILLTGPRRSFCRNVDQRGLPADQFVVFDTLTFRGVNPGATLAKRNFDDSRHKPAHRIHMVYHPELDGLVHGRHAPHLVKAVNEHLRKRAEAPMITDPVAAPPRRDNFGLNTATGSVDPNGLDGKQAGDHPMRTFPETYSAPLTLDPVQSASEDEPTVYDAKETSGPPPKFCDDGSLGCTCRDASAATECDHPYTCNSLGYCAQPPCPVGEAGCKAHSDGKCDDEALVVSSDGFCVYPPSCERGSIGCQCVETDDITKQCVEGSFCGDGRCIRPAEGVCSAGEPGCPCADNESCSGGSQCDGFSGLCLFESCPPGSRGCRCQESGTPCDDGFVCGDDGQCVESQCVPGSAGCKCLGSKACNKKGFTCVELDRNGVETMCVGQQLCFGPGSQKKRCEEECGVGNVLACGECSYSRPICRDPSVQYCNPKSYLYGVEPCPEVGNGNSAATAVLSFAAIVAAALAL